MFLPILYFGQDIARLRSSLQKLEITPEDTSRVNLLCNIGWDTSYFDLAVGRLYAEQGLTLAEKLDYKEGIVRACNVIGAICLDMGDLEKSLEIHLRGLHLADSMKLTKQIASGNMNLANVYAVRGNTAKQQEHLEKSIANYRQLEKSNGLGVALANLGFLYFLRDSIERAEPLFKEALELATIANDPFKIAASLSGMARCKARKGYTKDAVSLMQRALLTNDTAGNLYEYGIITFDYAMMNIDLQRFDSADVYFDKSMAISRRLNIPSRQQAVHEGRAKLEETRGNWQKALFHFREAAKLKDSLQTDRALQHLRNMETMYNLNEKEQAIVLLNQQKSSQRTYLWFAVAGCLLLLLFIGVLFNRNKLRQRTNLLLEKQKSQLQIQNATIEEKNKSITDSINYAQRIQSALWPRAKDFEQYLKGGFVMLRPKDIVSGDFYWLAERDGYIFLATVDCTGHGVPGGFMSMLGSLLLTEIITDKGVLEPAEVLNQLRSRVISALRQTGETNESKDGMDMVLCRYDKSTRELVYAAANNSFYIITGEELQECLPDKQPVGYHIDMKPFKQYAVTLTPD